MQRLLRGEMDRPAYLALLVNLSAIYAALEPALRHHATHPAIAPVFSTELFRSAALAADVRALRDGSRAPMASIEASTASYVARLNELDDSAPELLLAHAYVRYLGDLNGGQILKAIVCRSLALPDSAGTSFYDFGNAARTTGTAQRFRGGLAGMVLAPELANAVVDEAKRSFEMHVAIFEALRASDLARTLSH